MQKIRLSKKGSGVVRISRTTKGLKVGGAISSLTGPLLESRRKVVGLGVNNKAPMATSDLVRSLDRLKVGKKNNINFIV